MGIMCLMSCAFFAICNKFQKKKHIYKWLYAVPYGEAILAMFLCCFLFTGDIESGGLFFLTLIFVLLPFIHMFAYYCIPYYKTKIPHNKAFQLIEEVGYDFNMVLNFYPERLKKYLNKYK